MVDLTVRDEFKQIIWSCCRVGIILWQSPKHHLTPASLSSSSPYNHSNRQRSSTSSVVVPSLCYSNSSSSSSSKKPTNDIYIYPHLGSSNALPQADSMNSSSSDSCTYSSTSSAHGVDMDSKDLPPDAVSAVLLVMDWRVGLLELDLTACQETLVNTDKDKHTTTSTLQSTCESSCDTCGRKAGTERRGGRGGRVERGFVGGGQGPVPPAGYNDNDQDRFYHYSLAGNDWDIDKDSEVVKTRRSVATKKAESLSDCIKTQTNHMKKEDNRNEDISNNTDTNITDTNIKDRTTTDLKKPPTGSYGLVGTVVPSSVKRRARVGDGVHESVSDRIDRQRLERDKAAEVGGKLNLYRKGESQLKPKGGSSSSSNNSCSSSSSCTSSSTGSKSSSSCYKDNNKEQYMTSNSSGSSSSNSSSKGSSRRPSDRLQHSIGNRSSAVLKGFAESRQKQSICPKIKRLCWIRQCQVHLFSDVVNRWFGTTY
eukprot:GHVQ01034087.1.p1 GENE.GHVQ01034087.1~~GHVQ01034087.1.p1  ORF type:complete len:481 (+),score=133.39 GHVQ01034087.1:99-1541(+)